MHWILQSNLFNESAFASLMEQLERQAQSFDVAAISKGKLINPVREPASPIIALGASPWGKSRRPEDEFQADSTTTSITKRSQSGMGRSCSITELVSPNFQMCTSSRPMALFSSARAWTANYSPACCLAAPMI